MVTVICATLNAREAVRLTFSSFRRYTPEPCPVLVADNGSMDGTLDDLRALPWLKVFPLEERAGESSAASAVDPGALTEHGAALDWLAARVETPYFLTLDSDVEFLEAGWLGEMLEQMTACDLAALGHYEPGMDSYRPRLAPYALLLRTSSFRSLRTSFRGFVQIHDPAEARRWQASPRPLAFQMDTAELSEYRTAAFYSTAARVFERLIETRARWSDLPDRVGRKILHLGHMSWVSEGDSPAPEALRSEHAARLAYVRERLQQNSARNLR